MKRSYAQPEGHGAQNRGERLIVIANPRSAGGKTGDNRDRLERAVSRAFAQGEVWWTEGRGHATTLARKAVKEADIVAALGGDGTCSEVVNGLFDEEGNPLNRKVIFSVIPSGTGGDLVRSLDIPGSLEGALWVVSTGMTLALDVGELRWPDGRRRMFVNVAGIGLNAEVCERVNRGEKKGSGQITFLKAIFSSIREYRPSYIQWRWEGPDGPGEAEIETMAAFCGNGHYCGGGLYVGRGGSMGDGVFELTIVPPLGLLRAAELTPRFYTGTFHEASGMRRIRATKVEMLGEAPIEGDGEPLGPGPVTISVSPHTLQMRGGWLAPPRIERG